MPTYAEDVLFTAAGKNVGSNAAAPNVTAGIVTATTVTATGAISGATVTASGNGTVSGNLTVTGTAAIGGGTALATSNQTGTGNLVLATSPTIATPTITSPVINGNPSGTGIPTFTLKKGSGSGDYASASTTYVRVDTSNLVYTVTIPTGWKLLIHASGTSITATSAVQHLVALADGSADNSGILVERAVISPGTSFGVGFSLGWVISGDGASHTINLQYRTTNASDSVTISNSTATLLPTMTFMLSPSN